MLATDARARRRDLRQLLDSAEMSPGKALHLAYENRVLRSRQTSNNYHSG